MTERWTAEEYHEHLSRRAANKFGARKVALDGYTFDSQAEARRYLELKTLAAQGHIQALAVHPRFVLQEPFRTRKGERIRAIHYKADFEYVEHGVRVVEDVKGGRATQTAAFRLKRKLFMKRYPGVDFRIVTT